MADRQGVRGRLDTALTRLAPTLSPFYRRHPYVGPLWLTEVDIRGALSARDGFFFNRVPKAANSTIVANLVRLSAARSGRRPRPGREKWYFRRPLFATARDLAAMQDGVAFTFVRDPYTRTLSAFLDKILGRTPAARGFYRWWDGTGGGAGGGAGTPDFADFCRYLAAGGLYDDIHWAPQTALLLLPPERFDWIGRFETLDTDLTEILTRIFGPQAAPQGRAGPRSDARSALSRYTPETAETVARLYAADFEAFGYAKGPPSQLG